MSDAKYSLNWSGSDVVLSDGSGTTLHTFTSFECKDKDAMIAKLQKQIETLKGKLAKYMEDDKDKPEPATMSADKAVAMLADVSGRVGALEDKDEKREKALATESLATTTIKQLRRDGYYVSEDREADITMFAGLGQKALDTFLRSFRATASKDPEFEDAIVSEPSEITDPLLAKYANEGPDELKRAREADAQFQGLVDRGFYSAGERETFLESYGRI